MKKYIFISLGGILGAVLRYLLKTVPISIYHGNIPINTLAANITGCFLLAFVMTGANKVFQINADYKLGITAGFAGAYTTFSTLCKETVALIIGGWYISALFYCLASALLGFAAVYFGIIIAEKAARYVMKSEKNTGEHPVNEKR